MKGIAHFNNKSCMFIPKYNNNTGCFKMHIPYLYCMKSNYHVVLMFMSLNKVEVQVLFMISCFCCNQS